MSCFQKILSLSPAHPEAMAIPRPDFAAEVPGEKSGGQIFLGGFSQK